MAAEPTTYGFPSGSIDAAALPEWVKTARARFSVSGPDDWKVSPLGSLDRGIRVEVGTGHGDGVTVVTHEYETMSLPYPDVPTRWYLIARRRNWSGTGTATLVALPAGTTPSLPAVGDAPTQMKNKPGIESDQPIALVPVTQKDRTVGAGIINLHSWAGPGGVEAAHELALEYLREPGASVKVGSSIWRYELQANNVWDWREVKANPFIQSGNVALSTNVSGDVHIKFPQEFPTSLTSLVVTDTTSQTSWPPLVLKWIPGYSSKDRAVVRVYGLDGRALVNRTGLWMSYVATGY